MGYKVAIMPAAVRQLTKLPAPDERRIRQKIDALAVDPRPMGAKRLQGEREYLPLRAGDYRLVYTVDDRRLQVLVIKIGHRREVYRRL